MVQTCLEGKIIKHHVIVVSVLNLSVALGVIKSIFRGFKTLLFFARTNNLGQMLFFSDWTNREASQIVWV